MRLVAAFFGDSKGFFVEVGANEPQDGSQTWRFEQLGWDGVLIEPQQDLAERLRQRRRAKVYAVACSSLENSGKSMMLHIAGIHSSLVHGFFVDGVLRGAAELRPLGPAFAREAEAAISIETAWQSHGVGSALLRHTLLTARNRGIRLLHMACLAENRRMQQLARKFDAELSFDFGSVIGEVESSRPTPLSLMREAMADGHGFATAMLDLQTRMLRA